MASPQARVPSDSAPGPSAPREPPPHGGICRRDSSEPAQMWKALSDPGLPQTGAVGVTPTGAGTGTQRCVTGRAVAGPSCRGTAQRSPQAEREDRKPGQGPRQPERTPLSGNDSSIPQVAAGARSVAVHTSQWGWGANRLAPPEHPRPPDPDLCSAASGARRRGGGKAAFCPRVL